ncbi:MAG: hypothetical protein ABFD29_10475 [Anaerolineaceae bacterium]
METFDTKSNIQIVLDGDSSRVISFNPRDVMLRNRITQFMLNLQAKRTEIAERAQAIEAVTEKDEDGIPINIKDALSFNTETSEYFISQLDDIFGDGTSEKLFGPRAFDIELMLSFMTFIMDKINIVSKDKLETKLGRPLKQTKKAK